MRAECISKATCGAATGWPGGQMGDTGWQMDEKVTHWASLCSFLHKMVVGPCVPLLYYCAWLLFWCHRSSSVIVKYDCLRNKETTTKHPQSRIKQVMESWTEGKKSQSTSAMETTLWLYLTWMMLMGMLLKCQTTQQLFKGELWQMSLTAVATLYPYKTLNKLLMQPLASVCLSPCRTLLQLRCNFTPAASISSSMNHQPPCSSARQIPFTQTLARTVQSFIQLKIHSSLVIFFSLRNYSDTSYWFKSDINSRSQRSFAIDASRVAGWSRTYNHNHNI